VLQISGNVYDVTFVVPVVESALVDRKTAPEKYVPEKGKITNFFIAAKEQLK
jgi:hypothetical protein